VFATTEVLAYRRVQERGRRPGVRAMALCAVSPQPALMGVITSMATVTIAWRALELLVDVAVLALDLGVRTGEREVALAVIEGGIGPLCGAVTALALGTEVAFVLVVFLVAAIAIGRRAFELLVHVALFAVYGRVRIGQGEVGLAVVERSIVPLCGAVAGLALGAEVAFVLVVFLVAAIAIGRRAFELLVGVAILAFQAGMGTGERQQRLAVVKIQHLAGAIVASQAIIAETLAVFGHERGITFTVAIGTTRLRKGQVVVRMTILALEGPQPQTFMLFEGERSLFVGKIGPVQHIDRVFPSAMVRVAGFAIGHSLEFAVEALSGAHVVAFLCVTCQAPVRHVLAAERQRVASCAFPFKVGVGSHALQRFAFRMACAHLAGGKDQRSALYPAGHNNEEQHCQGPHEPLPRKDTYIFSHLRPPVVKIVARCQRPVVRQQ